MTRTPCACVSPDAHECWALRSGINELDYEAVLMDGRPCDCPCHDRQEDDDE